ncbi:MAG: exosome complex RNA-binding protein Csl4 [Candidatus Nezhaarchaeota archaeon]|nr:exosome complex RNA-binding protein Csl4 [Candidatus Nezhaarchaeota archaeon]MCX8141877.1 exosome complex RNA-binding protein Csl4 [Candidatus Nezhaarchaeota archaeon]MDW8050342.1 exosome complex RNA-binding protein Csl4 [Nitrososphaerota archaeon]
MNERLLKDLVAPGEDIGVIEEFLPGDGTYVDGGIIRSLRYGTAILDINERRVRVVPITRRFLVPERGDIIIGEVVGLKRDLAFVTIRKVENKGLTLSSLFHGVLHVSQVSDKFIDSISDTIRVLDIVRARIVNDKPSYQLSIRGKEFGVILAFCSNCQNPMIIKDRKLYCPQCRIQEERKLSTRYSISLKL